MFIQDSFLDFEKTFNLSDRMNKKTCPKKHYCLDARIPWRLGSLGSLTLPACDATDDSFCQFLSDDEQMRKLCNSSLSSCSSEMTANLYQ